MANIFLDANDTFTQASGNTGDTIFGRAGGSETVILQGNPTGTILDGNIEVVQVAGTAAATTLQVNASGQLVLSSGGVVYATFSSGLNVAVNLQFTDGNVTLTQTGAGTFTIASPTNAANNVTINSTTPQAGSAVTLGPDQSTAGGGTTGGGTGGGTGGTQSFVLTDSADNLVGTAGNDTFVATTDNTNNTVAPGDVVNGLGGTDRINVFNDANIGALPGITLTSVEQVFAQFDATAGADILNVSGFSDVTQGWVSKGTVNGADGVTLTKAQTAGIEGKIGVTTAATDTLNVVFSDATAATADQATLALNGADTTAFTLGTGGVVIDKIETLNVAATGANKLGTVDSDSVSTLAVTGAGSLSMTDGGQGSTFKTVTAADGGLTLNLVALAVAQNHTITTGAGADTITNLWANQTKDDKINLGGGEDKLVFTDAVTVTNATQQAQLSGVSNVEELGVNGAVALTIDGDLVTQTKFEAAGTGNMVLTDVANASTLTFGGATAAAVSTAAMKLGATTLNVNLEGSSTAASIVTAGKGLDVTGSTTINVVSSGSAGIAANQLALEAADNQTVNISGSQALTLTTAADPGTGTGFTISGSAATGALDITGTALGDAITGGSAADKLDGGAGVNTLTGGAGGDTFEFNKADVDTALGAVTDTITDFVTKSDKIDHVFGAGSATNYVEATSAAADLATMLAAADAALTGAVKYYVGQVGSDSYVVTDNNGTGYTDVIKLTGVSLTGIEFGDIV